MKIFNTLYLIIFVTICTLSCSTGPDFNRTNKRDPKSETFKPEPGTNPFIQISEQKNITISWSIDDNFRDGYIVKKQIRNNEDFENIDTLKKYRSNYVDDSKVFTTSTVYQLQAYVMRADTFSINKEGALYAGLLFSRFRITDVKELPDSISVFWEFISNHGYINFFDGFTIDIKPTSNSDWQPFDTLRSSKLYQKNMFSFPKPDSLINIDFRVNTFLEVGENNLEYINNKSSHIYINSISDLNSEITNELKGQLSWTLNTPDVEGF